jgi:hypothetical protein
MTAKNLIRLTYHELARRVALHGFTYEATLKRYVRPTESAKQVILLNVAKFKTEIHVAVEAGIRFEALERAINDAREDLDDLTKAVTLSLGCELGSYHFGIRRVWTIRKESETAKAAEEMLRLVELAGLPFFEKYSTMDKAFPAFSGDDKESEAVDPFRHARAERALGVAFLRGDRVLFDELLARKAKLLHDLRDFGNREFLQIAERLSARFVSR